MVQFHFTLTCQQQKVATEMSVIVSVVCRRIHNHASKLLQCFHHMSSQPRLIGQFFLLNNLNLQPSFHFLFFFSFSTINC